MGLGLESLTITNMNEPPYIIYMYIIPSTIVAVILLTNHNTMNCFPITEVPPNQTRVTPKKKERKEKRQILEIFFVQFSGRHKAQTWNIHGPWANQTNSFLGTHGRTKAQKWHNDEFLWWELPLVGGFAGNMVTGQILQANNHGLVLVVKEGPFLIFWDGNCAAYRRPLEFVVELSGCICLNEWKEKQT